MAANNKIVTPQNEEIQHIPWNKSLSEKKSNNPIGKIIFLLFIFSIFLIVGFHFLTKPIKQTMIVEQSLPSKDQYWLKQKMNLANIPFDPNYNNLDETDKNSDVKIDSNKQIYSKTLSEEMLIEHSPETLIDAIKDKHKID